MANWVADFLTRNPDMAAKAVAKRARHGIHFDLGGRDRQAYFTGKPCHYLDTDGLWKPIDTSLIAKSDGWYGAPHSDIVIHPDGRVKVGDYQQYTELPGSPIGKLTDGMIIRSFAGGEQRLSLTEDGFREEIFIEKKTFPIEKFIYTKSGLLPDKYKSSPIMATDVDGKEASFGDNQTAELGAWLEGAKYPVTIDPDFLVGSGCASVNGNNADYATARSTSTSFTLYDANSFLNLGQNTGFSIYRHVYKFDTSSLDNEATIAQVNFRGAFTLDQSNTDFDVYIKKYNWSSYVPISNDNRESVYDGVLAADNDDNIWLNTSGKSANTVYTSGNLSTSWVNKTGITYYGLISGRDVAGIQPFYTEILRVAAVFAAESYRPVLTVAYSTAGNPYYAYAQQ